jgi:hypothetical protein
MDDLIVCYSKLENMEQTADAIAGERRSAGSIRMMRTDNLTVADIDGADMVAGGAPICAARKPKELRPALETLPKGALSADRVAASDTSHARSWNVGEFTAARLLGRKLCQLGGERILPPRVSSSTTQRFLSTRARARRPGRRLCSPGRGSRFYPGRTDR